jgi:3',5'-cyclic AMP phosphodiesterase CpdA
VRIVQLSDIHVWRYSWNPLRLMSKRTVGIVSLLAGRAKKFRLERLEAVVERVKGLEPDHVLITGDLTTTALPGEFADALAALAPLLADPSRVTVIPGNHDRYTTGSVRHRHFEQAFGAFMPRLTFPWLRPIDARTAILGLDATRSHLSPTGRLPLSQLDEARSMVADPASRARRLIVACHYPVVAPPVYAAELAAKRMKNAEDVRAWLSTLGPHLYCCGHVHAAWAFAPPNIPDQLCLNSGAPLLRDPTGLRPPGFLEITLHDRAVSVVHHAWDGTDWSTLPLHQAPDFFPAPSIAVEK